MEAVNDEDIANSKSEEDSDQETSDNTNTLDNQEKMERILTIRLLMKMEQTMAKKQRILKVKIRIQKRMIKI